MKYYVIPFSVVPPPTVKLISDNEAITSKNFSLTALINIHPTVDTPIVTNSSWNRENEDIDAAPRVTIINSNSSSVVQFAPLISSDGGTYYFSTRVRALDSKYLCPSSLVNDSIDISPSKCTAYTITLFMNMRIIYIFCHFGTCDDSIYNANSIYCKRDNFRDKNI